MHTCCWRKIIAVGAGATPEAVQVDRNNKQAIFKI